MHVILKADRLVVGDGTPPVANGAVIVRGNTIAFAGPSAAAPPEPDARVIDLGDATLMPGLIDVHVHLTNDGGAGKSAAAVGAPMQSQAEYAFRGYANALRTVQFGYTTLRNVHAPLYADIELRNAIDSGRLPGPRLLVSGHGLCITGGHMDKGYLPSQLTLSDRVGVCDTPEGFRQAVRAHVKRKVDLIKINSDVGSMLDPERPYRQEMSFDEMKAACDEAHKFGLRVSAHTTGGEPIEEAVSAGVDTVEHGHWMTDRAIEIMLERQAYYVPTLIVNSENFAYDRETLGASESSWDWMKRAFDAKWGSLERVKNAGVKIAAGSDAGFLVQHGDNARELEEMVKGGFTPLEAIRAATETAADLLNLQDTIGTLTAGKRADVIAVRGNPAEDVRVLQDERNIPYVFRDGIALKSPDSFSHT
jgi:imidazolonepropionase-like amidohydrolase